IADIVGVAIAVTSLQISAVTSSPIPTGHGEITIDHGRVPLPAPATAEILCGFPVAPTNIPYELTTPTGAAIITTLTECFGDGIGSFGPPPSMIPHRIGYGAGTSDLEGQANVLRITLGHRHEQSIAPEITMAGIDSDRVALIETNLDDADPQMIAGATQRLLRAGALDVWQTPCVMKKGRLATVVSVLASTELAPTIQTILLTHTTSIGVRRHFVERAKLPRRDHHVDTDLGRVPGKLVTLPDGGMRWKPDDDAIRNLTEKTGQSSHTLHSVAQTQFQSSSQSDLETQ
ncbi:MAG: LarC family nickel insertion protein, partial [Planctomycetota bacterium]